MKLATILCSALLILNTGCLKTVTLRTVIHDDGSVDRHIKIESANGAHEDEDNERDGAWGGAPSVDSDLDLPDKEGWEFHRSEDNVFEARGTFKSVADIPLDFRKGDWETDGEGEEERFVEKSKSEKAHQAFRCALFSIHEYTETITDCTSPDEFQKAVEELIELRTLGYAIIEKAYGEEFDFSDAKAYIEKEIVPRLRRFAVICWDLRRDKNPGREDRFLEAMAKLFRELGMKLPEDLDSDEAEKAPDKWVLEKLSELVKRKNGEPLTPEEVEERLKAVGGGEDETLGEVAQEIIKEKYGSEDAFAEYMEGIADRLLGAYFEIFGHGFWFDAIVIMPGRIVEANGFIDGHEVSWQFDDEDVFPGYTMRARSVAFTKANDLGADQTLIASVTDAVALAGFIEELDEADRDRVLTAIEEVAERGSPVPLRRLSEGDAAIPGLADVLKKIGLAKQDDGEAETE